MTRTSTWAALGNPMFRQLWIAALISGTCVAAHDTAATWMMNMLTPSPLLISLLSTVASLPFFLFTLPAGALADMVDRKKLLCVVNLWLTAAAAGLAILGWLHLLNPYVILANVFLIGVGFALNAPAWTSSVSEVVSNAQLPSAATLGGLQLNISGIIGPALGGLLVPLIGPNFVFAVNATCFLVVILAVLRWKRTAGQSRTGLESFFVYFLAAIRYVRYAPGLQIVLARNALFALFISVIPALMPVLGLRVLHLDPSQLGLLFTSLGAGSIAGAAFIIPWLRARYSSKYPHHVGEFASCTGLCVDGICPPERAFLCCRSASWFWMGSVCFRALGSSAARYTRLGAKPHERHRNHGFAGRSGSWRGNLGFCCRKHRKLLRCSERRSCS
jgi:MFS family permease